jgi:hypothetical protein
MNATFRDSVDRFLEDMPKRIAASKHTPDEKRKIEAHQANIRAYLTHAGFLEHLEQNWKGPELVVAIVVAQNGDVRGSLVKRPDAFAFANMKDDFLKEARLVMSADDTGVVFQELGYFTSSDA